MTGRRLFVVEDEESVRSSLARLLTTLGFDTMTYASAESFLGSYGGDADGCLLLDLRMPGMNGLDLIEELRRRRSTLPIIVMTGHTDSAAAGRLKAFETVGFLEKPFSVQQLQGVLRRWLETLD
jgi:two-component system, LuxR family, response regulator FixJ